VGYQFIKKSNNVNKKGKKIFKIVLYLLLSVLFLSSVTYFIYGRYAYSKILRKISAVELGMTKDEVVAIMGSPIKKLDSDSLEYWYFDAPPICAELPTCVFDKRTGNAVETIWDTTIKK
jgi:hypothetical protein